MATRDAIKEPKANTRYIPLSDYSKPSEGKERPKPARQRSQNWMQTWTPELLSAALSIALLVVTIVILQTYSDKPQPEFALSLSLNGLLQILITITQFAFCYPLARGLAQLKWLWFLPSIGSRDASSRPLHKFEVYDEACRSNLLGSLRLIFRLGWGGRNRLVTHAIALILASAALTGPVTQQVLSIDTETLGPAPNGTATVGRVVTLNQMSPSGIFETEYADSLSLRGAIFNAGQATSTRKIGQSRQAVVPPLEPRCSTASCEWKRYGSIGMCGRLVNMTSSSNKTATRPFLRKIPGSIDTAMSLFINATTEEVEEGFRTGEPILGSPVYQSLNYVTVFASDEPALPDEQSEAFKRASALELVVGYTDEMLDMVSDAKRNNIDKFRFLAMQFWYCVKTFETRVLDGVHETREIESDVQIDLSKSTSHTLNTAWGRYRTSDELGPLDPATASAGFREMDMARCADAYVSRMNRSLVLTGPPALEGDETAYRIDGCTAWLLGAHMATDMQGLSIFGSQVSYEFLVNGLLGQPLGQALYGGINVTSLEQNISAPSNNLSDATRWENVEVLVTSIADSLTNMMRASAPSLIGNDDAMAVGVALAPIALIRVRWAWLSLMAVQVALTAVLLATVIVVTCRSEVGVVPKDCSIATLCTLDLQLRSKLGPLSEDMTGLRQRSKGLKARLERRPWDEGGEAELLLVEETADGSDVGSGKYSSTDVESGDGIAMAPVSPERLPFTATAAEGRTQMTPRI
ncbi:hypothetical protein QBC34DRAFT_478369 [Podospora aff. communis PSN243]|uniref:Uncharacterized protein n=1 Tax=Podospora aff. communis PSN243 TaxID=3040156 RepID=A0AAV9G5P6_9PEZI|nr:hypothetical protein QBC34DRAFT_478369 [Podospora aff. communis PSN243]